jgi:DNA-binding LacI/PurR family transcriptional regulator
LASFDRNRRQSGRTTLSDVARATDVSPITVSRALRGERSVAPELVDRVRLAAAQLGYVPDHIAVAGFNDLAGSDQMVPPLTSVRTPRSAMGQAGAQMLLELMRGDVPERNSLDLGFELKLSGSS